MPERHICVLGAGIAGLGTAVAIQQLDPNVKVTIIADKFSPDVTSDIAAGFIFPVYLGNMPNETVERWIGKTFSYIEEYMIQNPNGGIQETSGYTFSNEDGEEELFRKYFKNYTRLSPEENKKLHPDNPKYGHHFTTYYIEATKQLTFLQKQFIANGGKLVKQRLNTIDDIPIEFDIIVNCTGLGSRFLFNDERLVPHRGQIIRVRCPAMKFFHRDGQFYALQNDDCIILGGTKDLGEWDTTVNQETAQMILNENIRRVPLLKDAQILSHHVGLRPYRDAVRLEVSYEQCKSRTVPVVHNYGHGGSGVTLFWGCATDAAKLAVAELAKLGRVLSRL